MSNQEAPFSFTTKVAGDLFTIRGDSFDEFLKNLTLSANIASVSNLISELNGETPHTTEQAVANVQQVFPEAQVTTDSYTQPVPPQQPQFVPQNFAPVAPPAAPAAPAAGVNCAHGPMKLMPAGVSKKTGKPYNAFYACQWPTREEQCKTQPAA